MVKTEFGKYADVLAKLKKKLNEAQSTIDKAETRTRAIQRKLRDVEGVENMRPYSKRRTMRSIRCMNWLR